jgi:hypothetical protein
MLGIDHGVLVGTDKRTGNTLSGVKSNSASRILPIRPVGLVTGCGLAALQSEDGQLTRVDIFTMLRKLCRYPQFRFREPDFQRVGQAWVELISDHLKNCDPRHWPESTPCGYWFKTLFVHQEACKVEAWDVTFTYERGVLWPQLGYSFDTIKNEYVTQGHLLMEGDQSGAEYLERDPANSVFPLETHKAWTSGINPAEVQTEKGARIIKDAIYANHLRSGSAYSERGAGDTCDIAFVDRSVGFRWFEQNVSAWPPLNPAQD